MLAPAFERRPAALRGQAASPPVAVERPAHLHRSLGKGPVEVTHQPDAADEASALELVHRPVAEADLAPLKLEAGNLPRGVPRTHELSIFRLGIDLGQRLHVFLAPLAEEGTLGAEFRG